jgi:ATP-dependent exoDNAse (exonuclease V) alpha subunit
VKVGAQIMLLNNDSNGRWVNGTVGRIVGREAGRGGDPDLLVVELGDGRTVDVVPYTWEMFRFVFDEATGRLESEVVGAFTQYPLMLAWAVTIHKSQGKTFDRVIIDMGRGAFAHGQTYVALSRCTTLAGIVLVKPIETKHILLDWRIVRFLTAHQYQASEERLPLSEKVARIEAAIKEGKCLRMVYLKSSDEKSVRVVRPEEVGAMEYEGKEFQGLRGYCFSRKDTRVFRVDRILELSVISPPA